ncbi:MAG: hypothetical protein B7Y99_09225 [Caulobacterales bacterium 32-69-10]|nr:MAG: hypothetical protein B7Y99_09225 [Caulobacterales bacterium 32-69-10]
MRLIAALLATAAAATLGPGVAHAVDEGQAALFGAAFSSSPDFTTDANSIAAGPGFSAPGGYAATRYEPGRGLMRWTTSEVVSFGGEGVAHFDTVRVSTFAYDPLPGAALMRPDAQIGAARPQGYNVTYVRKWPAMVSVSKGRLSLDVTPQMGLGLSKDGGRSAEAGALVRMAKAVGFTGQDAPRWYVYAGYHKRAMGLNLLRSDDPARRQKLDDGVAREVQAGLGAHRGRIHALVGYTHENLAMRSLGQRNRSDDRIGLSLAIR